MEWQKYKNPMLRLEHHNCEKKFFTSLSPEKNSLILCSKTHNDNNLAIFKAVQAESLVSVF